MTQLDLTLWRATGGIIGVMAIGGCLPFLVARKGRSLSWGLAFAAGILLASAFFHLMPEAYAAMGAAAGMWVLGGFLFLYLFERFITVHICETLGCHVHTVGLSALFGLSIHTFANGVAIGAGVLGGLGNMVFLAVAAHKLPEAYSLTTILLHERYDRARIMLMNLLFMSMIPLGVWSVRWLVHPLSGDEIVAWTLAFSAGTFVHIAVSDLLPEVHQRSHERIAPAVAFLLGIVMVAVVGQLSHR
ncbi:MAG: ZIP family metal transporter [Deltaproteobacteria bacterium]|nr:ZIP family metal transporter [Deltaproteobacteria bacterium]